MEYADLAKLSQKFEENVLDATKKFEKLIADKREIEGLPALGLAAQIVVFRVLHWMLIPKLFEWGLIMFNLNFVYPNLL
ncbi:unnamed protein product [Ilex paraguariensis]|uniref:Uncharacterized protein n=1 Tax=Ilex paraguariensis TaxID=185542 RepID=A0ABC8TTS2_9AQUA